MAAASAITSMRPRRGSKRPASPLRAFTGVVLLALTSMLLAGAQAWASHIPGEHYSGTTEIGGGVSLDVSADGNYVSAFEIWDVPLPCGGVLQTDGFGGDPIVDHAFSFSEPYSNFSYSGSFPSYAHAEGVLSFDNPFDPGCSLENVSWTVEVRRTLTVAIEGGGQGDVQSSPEGIDCSWGSCDARFPLGDTVTLTATPSTSSTFAGWTGCDTTNGTTCTVQLEADRQVGVTFNLDTTAPETTIDSGPSGTIDTNDVSFAFSASESNASFECVLEGGSAWDWEDCTSPKPYSDLPDGDYAFKVRAFDTAFNYDQSPASRSFRVDTTGPGPPVDTTPPETSITKHPKKKTTKKKATFEFAANEPKATFECSLDKGAWESCSSPRKVKVKPGKHSFAVRATDRAGNTDESPATYKWKRKR